VEAWLLDPTSRPNHTLTWKPVAVEFRVAERRCQDDGAGLVFAGFGHVTRPESVSLTPT